MTRKRSCAESRDEPGQVPPPTQGYGCETCYRVFTTRAGLYKHVKNTCDHRPHPFGCPHCKKDCRSSQGLYRHRLICSNASAATTDEPIDALREEIRQLRQQILPVKEAVAQPSSVQIQHNTTNNHIQIMNFDLRNGSEYDTSHMTPEKVRDILHRFRPCHLPQAGNHLLQLLYSNPVNRNIRKGSLYHKLCEVFMDDEWRSMPESNVIRTLTYDLFSAALEHYEQLKSASKNHSDVLNEIISEREPYEPEAREVVRAALFDVTRKYLPLGGPRASTGEEVPGP